MDWDATPWADVVAALREADWAAARPRPLAEVFAGLTPPPLDGAELGGRLKCNAWTYRATYALLVLGPPAVLPLLPFCRFGVPAWGWRPSAATGGAAAALAALLLNDLFAASTSARVLRLTRRVAPGLAARMRAAMGAASVAGGLGAPPRGGGGGPGAGGGVRVAGVRRPVAVGGTAAVATVLLLIGGGTAAIRRAACSSLAGLALAAAHAATRSPDLKARLSSGLGSARDYSDFRAAWGGGAGGGGGGGPPDLRSRMSGAGGVSFTGAPLGGGWAVVLASDQDDGWLPDLVAAVEAGRRVLLVYGGLDPAAPSLTPALLSSLERAYTAVAATAPCADVVPVVVAAGSSDGVAAVAARLASAAPGCVVVPAAAPARAAALASALGAAAVPGCGGGGGRRVEVAPPRPPPSPSTRAPLPPPPIPPGARPPYARVAVGGTFDRLHAGHRLLLAAAALAARDALFIGVTDGALVANKKGRAPLQPYAQRAAAAAAFARSVGRPNADTPLTIETAPLLDPAEPTAAETDGRVGALVVSAETVPGGLAIAEGRAGRGLPPLDLIVVGLVGGGGGAGGGKISSTALRDAEGGG